VAYYFDKNKDRDLSRTEFHNMLGKLGFEILSDLSDKIFNEIDTNGNGIVDYFEFIRAIKKATPSSTVRKPLDFDSIPKEKEQPKRAFSGLEVYIGDADPFSWRISLALQELGLDYDEHVITKEELKSEKYLKINPRGQTPTLVANGVPVFESLAILLYLADTYPKKSAVLPTERQRYAKTLTRLMETEYLAKAGADVHRLTSKPDWEDLKEERVALDKALHTEFSRWENYLGEEGPYIVGKGITLADVAIFPILAWFNTRTPKPFEQYPKLKHFYELFAKRPTAQGTWPVSLK